MNNQSSSGIMEYLRLYIKLQILKFYVNNYFYFEKVSPSFKHFPPISTTP